MNSVPIIRCKLNLNKKTTIHNTVHTFVKQIGVLQHSSFNHNKYYSKKIPDENGKIIKFFKVIVLYVGIIKSLFKECVTKLVY